MRVFFLRHGEADWPNWKKSDDERPLTERGKREMQQVGVFLARFVEKPLLILTSPLPRASQTAEIAAKHVDAKCITEKEISPGFDHSELKKLVKKHPIENMMVVGHEPDFSEIIADLTGAAIKLSKAGVALVEIEPSLRKARLLWLLPPKLMKR